jgi:hypothetical protein
MKVQLLQALTNKSRDIMKEAQQLQLECKQKIKTKLSRMVKLTDPTLTEEQAEEYTEDPKV